MRNGSFETRNFDDWVAEVEGLTNRPWQISRADQFTNYFVDPTSPQDGRFVAWCGFDGDGPVEYRLYQDLTVPDDSPAQLSWQHRLQWAFLGLEAKSRAYSVELVDPESGQVLEVLHEFSTGDASSVRLSGDSGWETHTADLAALGYSGQTVRLLFRAQVPDSFTGPGQLEVDNVQLWTGTVWPENVDDLIRDFVAPKTGVYYVRVTGTPLTRYSLMTARNMEFDLESNDTIESAQDLLVPDVSGRQWILARLRTIPPHRKISIGCIWVAISS